MSGPLLKEQLIKPKYDWKKLTDQIVEKLELKYEPVGVYLIPTEHAERYEKFFESFSKPNGRLTYCQAVDTVRGATNYSKLEKRPDILFLKGKDFLCSAGAANLGLYELPEPIKNGERDFLLRRFPSIEASKVTREMIPHFDAGSISSVIVFKLSEAPVDPHVVLVFGNPAQILSLEGPYVMKTGGRLQVDVLGTCGVCAEMTVSPLLNRKMNLSTLCGGARSHAFKDPTEMGVGIPGIEFPDLVENLLARQNIPKRQDLPKELQ
ncbi:MAG: DUF169 domain-containing protein [Thermotogae bacterium]|jgi:uncharacterized protein (DUF169 family)|nr:DUF169 domain-containing protein [Thermotogota bacterium]